jgi:hypothetical protein
VKKELNERDEGGEARETAEAGREASVRGVLGKMT